MQLYGKQEKFCQIIATENSTPGEAAFRAGYGKEAHPNFDFYHTKKGSELMKNKKISSRIEEIRADLANIDGKYKSSLVQRLRDIIEFDVGKYMMSTTIQLNNGDIRESYTMKKKIQDWDPIERATVINGLDSQGRPKFIDKQWAFEKLLGLYNLNGKDNTDIEDLQGLLSGLGLNSGVSLADADTVTEEENDEEVYDESEEIYGELPQQPDDDVEWVDEEEDIFEEEEVYDEEL